MFAFPCPLPFILPCILPFILPFTPATARTSTWCWGPVTLRGEAKTSLFNVLFPDCALRFVFSALQCCVCFAMKASK
ncbi:unnamed protein product [Penicillium roqueforti FM164]|uniref:Genomic scaffold, ProqFM164S02 n=1 Tax=Penicillium roqueforti (strain FM164) TaxID=1365484 RepID=W6Q911_PENRF|nr:unnamed protein product [Penicillium roqueforti FM164]